MRVAVQLPAFLMTQGDANSPSHVLRAALAERLAGHNTASCGAMPMPVRHPSAPAEAPSLAVPAE